MRVGWVGGGGDELGEGCGGGKSNRMSQRGVGGVEGVGKREREKGAGVGEELHGKGRGKRRAERRKREGGGGRACCGGMHTAGPSPIGDESAVGPTRVRVICTRAASRLPLPVPRPAGPCPLFSKLPRPAGRSAPRDEGAWWVRAMAHWPAAAAVRARAQLRGRPMFMRVWGGGGGGGG